MHLCLQVVLNSESIESLQKHCTFICETPPPYPIITELLPNRYLITNIQKELELQCGTELKLNKIFPISTGTLQATIPCQCQIMQDNLILITKVQPCDNSDSEEPHLINLIPASWTKLKTLKLFPLQSGIKHEFDNLTEILDSNWTFNSPTYQVTKLKKIKRLVLKNNEFDLFNDTKLLFYILMVWTGLLSITCIVLIYCVNIQAIKINLLTPARDYPNTNRT